MSDRPEPRVVNTYERERLSSATRQLLCAFASGDPQRSLPQVDADWNEVLAALVRNGLLGMAHYYLSRQDYPPLEFRQWIERDYRTSRFYTTMMYRRILPTLTELTAAGIDFLVLKGPALASLVYPDAMLRPFNDLDILVRERDWTTVHHQLVKMGFHPVDARPTPPPKLIPQVVSYESKYKHPESKLLVEVHYDDLLNTGLSARDFEGFWQRSIMIDIQGASAKTLSLEDHLLHLCAHAHYHGYTRLNWLTDIALIVRDRAEAVDWKRFIEIVRTEQAEVGAYYTLYYTSQILDVHIPESVMNALRPDRFRRFWHEHYLPSERVIMLEPSWRPDFSFYFLPLFKRLLPDLLVMGRRREKLMYLLRLLVPPQEWLRFYYHMDADTWVLPAYILHPLKLSYHYVAEILQSLKLLPPRDQNLDASG